MIDKDLVKRAYQSGAYTPLLDVIREIVERNKDFEFSKNPYENAYRLGKRDQAVSLISEIEESITFYCQ